MKPDELELRAALASGGDGAYAVYADWLEEQGRTDDAAFVRAALQRRTAERQLNEATQRIAALRPTRDPEWLRPFEQSEDSWILVSVDGGDGPDRFLVRYGDMWPALRACIDEDTDRSALMLRPAVEFHLGCLEERDWRSAGLSDEDLALSFELPMTQIYSDTFRESHPIHRIIEVSLHYPEIGYLEEAHEE